LNDYAGTIFTSLESSIENQFDLYAREGIMVVILHSNCNVRVSSHIHTAALDTITRSRKYIQRLGETVCKLLHRYLVTDGAVLEISSRASVLKFLPSQKAPLKYRWRRHDPHCHIAPVLNLDLHFYHFAFYR